MERLAQTGGAPDSFGGNFGALKFNPYVFWCSGFRFLKAPDLSIPSFWKSRARSVGLQMKIWSWDESEFITGFRL